MNILITAILITGLNSLSVIAQEGGRKARKVDLKEYTLGETDAHRDLKQGKIVYKIIGQPCQIDQELKRVSLKEYNIVVMFHGCAIGPRIDYDNGYRDTVVAHLKKKYSFDPILKIERELREKERSQE